MSYYGYPGVVINNVYYPRYSDRYYPHYSDGLTVIRKSQLQAQNISHVSLTQESVQGIGKISLSKITPATRPEHNNIQIEKLSKNKVFLHKNEKSKEPRKFTSRVEDSVLKYPDLIRERDNIHQKSSYPASPQISLKKFGKEQGNEKRGKKSISPVSRFLNYLSKEGRTSEKSIRSIESHKRSSSNKSSIKSRSPSRSKTAKIKSAKRSSSSSSSNKTRTSSRKSKSTKRKKKK
jgi:hypothetical protein